MNQASLSQASNSQKPDFQTLTAKSIGGDNRFTSYQKLVVFLLALTQFTVVLDFMVMAPLGDFMMKSLKISTAQFGVAVSAYAFCAGISGLLAAGFADKFDRKKLLLFFYVGFAIGTLFCALAPNYNLLVAARVVTGIFGGVIASISMAIVADLFDLKQRGRVMGIIQMAFGSSQVLGIPAGLFIANAWGWHIPFVAIAVLAAVIALILYVKLQPITAHLAIQNSKSPFKHLLHTVSQKNYQIGFLATGLLSIGGFMLMPFGAVFAVNNVKVSPSDLPLMYMITGAAIMFVMPVIGKLSDTYSKFNIFAIATVVAVIFINLYASYTATPFWIVVLTNVLLMSAIMGRMAPSMALSSAVPDPQDRGAYMSINSSLQQISGGFGAMLAGAIVVQKDHYAPIEHFDTMAVIASAIMLLTIFLVYRVSEMVKKKA